MKRKFLVLLCLVTILSLLCTSCDAFNKGTDDEQGGDETCEHTFSKRWSMSATEHWHVATCEHATEKSDLAKHSDADENGMCDVCEYEIGHYHTWASEWSSDANYHWKNATCSHTGEKGEIAEHNDANKNGACDVCQAHVHVVDIYGVCTVCNEQVAEPDVTNLAYIIPVVLSNSNRINSGKISFSNVNTSIKDEEKIANTQLIDYILGNAGAYYKMFTETYRLGLDDDATPRNKENSTQEAWYELLADDTLSGVYRTEMDGEVSGFMIDDSPARDLLSGFYFTVSTLTDAYGAENVLNNLYKLAISASASDYEAGYDNGVYSFSFNYLSVNTDTAEGEGNHVDYYEVSVSFTVSDNGALTTLNIECDCYTNSPESELDQDYTYDQNSNTITMKDTAVADTYVYAITQTEGERTYTPEYTKSSFIPEDFDAFIDMDRTEELGETVTITIGDFVDIYMGNCTPEYASVDYIIDTLAVTVDESVSYFGYGNNVSFYPSAVGTYPVTFTLGGKTISFTLEVEAEEIVGGGDEQPTDGGIYVTITDNNGWFDIAEFTAPADGDYTFIIPAGYGAYSVDAYNKFGLAYVDPDDPNSPEDKEGGSFTVSLAAGETHQFYVKYSKKNVTVYISYTVSEYTGTGNAGGNGGVATGIVGGSYFGTGAAGTCTLDIDTATNTVIMNGYTYMYTFEEGDVVLYLNGNPMADYLLDITVGSDGVPTEFVWNGNYYDVTVGEDDSVDSIVEGTYTGTDRDGNQALTVVVAGNTVTFTFVSDLEGTETLVVTYVIEHGYVLLYNDEGTKLPGTAATLVIDEDGTPVSATFNGSYTLAK